MPQSHYPTAEEVKRLLGSSEIKSFEKTVAERMGLPLLSRHEINTPDIQRRLYLANLTVEDAHEIVRSDTERLLEWNKQLNQTEDEHPDGEFPEGEELGEENASEIIGSPLGVAAGFSIQQICAYHLASQEKAEALLSYLEKTRMPYRKKVSSEWRRIYRQVRATETK